MNVFAKDPAAQIDFTHDWAADYLDGEETIVASSWSVQPDGLVVEGAVSTASTATVTISGGTAGCLYRLGNEITTSAGRIDRRSIGVRVQSR
jgi:hypothetical protein